jgi:hypothetical protein
MKTIEPFLVDVRVFISVMVLLCLPFMAYSQCEPDLINCVDVDEPGQMCPSVLPDGFVNDYYDQIITVLTPESGSVVGLNIKLHKLRLESVENLPEGIEFHSETNEFFANRAYCITLNGTPSEIGVYKLIITATLYIRVLGIPIRWGQHVDSTSIVMTIKNGTSINTFSQDEFSLINAYPNPFETTVRIGFCESSPAESELRVFNMMGRLVYQERIMGVSGENYFEFNGQDLTAGYYIYSIIRENRPLMGRMVKRR